MMAQTAKRKDREMRLCIVAVIQACFAIHDPVVTLMNIYLHLEQAYTLSDKKIKGYWTLNMPAYLLETVDD